MNLGPGSPSEWLSARNPDPDHKGFNPQPIAEGVPSESGLRLAQGLLGSGGLEADADDVQETEIQSDCKHVPCSIG